MTAKIDEAIAAINDQGVFSEDQITCLVRMLNVIRTPAPAPQEAMGGEQLAQLFHETYERLAPSFGYETRKESAKPWADVPEKNKLLMIAVCAEISTALSSQAPAAMREGDLEALKQEAVNASFDEEWEWSGNTELIEKIINHLHKRGLLRVGEK